MCVLVCSTFLKNPRFECTRFAADRRFYSFVHHKKRYHEVYRKVACNPFDVEGSDAFET